MKLYNIPQESTIIVRDGSVVFKRLDGMYSVCETEYGGIYHLYAGTDLEFVSDGVYRLV